jgi:thiosulfate dehydrogenase [quinone] large subunit
MNTSSFLLLRLAVGTSMLGHGLARLPKLHAFSGWMVGTFAKSMLSQALVVPFSYILPIAEFTIGLLLVTGLFTRQALIGGSMVMIMLIFGTCMIEDWAVMPSQFIHIAFFTLLLQFTARNTWAIDKLFTQSK